MRTPLVRSPYCLFQEELRELGLPGWEWRMLVMCKLVNLATARIALRVAVPLFENFGSPEEMGACEGDPVRMGLLVDVLRPLGLQRRRAAALSKMSGEYANGIRPPDLFGCGKYANDSWTMFVEGELAEDVKDGKLRLYVDWALGRRADGVAGPPAAAALV
jgi:hypothetical protein